MGDAHRSMLAHLTTIVNLIKEGMVSRETTLDDLLADI
jgi:hypothetical protein